MHVHEPIVQNNLLSDLMNIRFQKHKLSASVIYKQEQLIMEEQTRTCYSL